MPSVVWTEIISDREILAGENNSFHLQSTVNFALLDSLSQIPVASSGLKLTIPRMGQILFFYAFLLI